MPTVASIVEGFGDRPSVPILIRRIGQEILPGCMVEAPPGIRIPRGTLVREGEVERAVSLAALQAGPGGAILLLVDADDDCPAVLGPTLLERARAARNDIAIGVVLAKFEFENWFLAAAESLRGRRELSEDLAPPADPEAIRGAKGWLDRHMPARRSYSETSDQPALTAVFDMQAARMCDSFDKCWREINRLLSEIC